ncbi:MAG: DUF2520 domain-containing protein [Candidatus Acidiferrales bacterium]
MDRTLSIIGAGRLGRALGTRLHGLGWRACAVVTRSPATARAAVRAIGAGRAYSGITFEVFTARVILIATPDGEIERTAALLAKIGGAKCRGRIFLHCSGALDYSALRALERRGGVTGSLHPMQTFTGRKIPRLDGVIFSVEGQPAARRVAAGIARSLGGTPVTLRAADKAAYHAAGVLVAGHALGLTEAAVRKLMSLGFTRRRALQALLPLMRQMLDNYESAGARAAWTGPVARSDFVAVAKHHAALSVKGRARRRKQSSGVSCELLAAYEALALLSARVLSPQPERTLRRLKQIFVSSQGGVS